MLRGVDKQACVSTSWGTGSTSSGEPSWNCCLLHIEFYVVLQNSRLWPSSSLLLRTEGYKSAEKPFPEFQFFRTSVLQSWKTSMFLALSLPRFACLSKSPDFSRLPSFIPLFSVSDCAVSQIPMSFLSEELQCFAKNETFFSSNSADGVTEVWRHETCIWGLLLPKHPKGFRSTHLT